MILLPPAIVSVDRPVVYLAGPVLGARDWQSEAAALLEALDSRLAIANPRGTTTEKDADYALQVRWEEHFMPLAAREGVLLFWLAREDRHDCSRTYAQTTRFELGEWLARDGRLAIGIDEGFSGDVYIHQRFGRERPEVPLCSTLEATCRAAVDLLAMAGR